LTVVAIDGPAGSGKSTIAGALAKRLGVTHVDTGAYYRAAALAVLRAGVPADDVAAVERAVAAARITRQGGTTLLDGEDVESEIRGAPVTATVSSVSRHAQVRRLLVELQRAEVAAGGAVVEGRDAGTVVVPDATLKIWLTASPGERARRRAAQLGDSSAEAIAAHERDIQRRDEMDAAQMARADDAIEIDTTGRTIAQILDDIVERLQAVQREAS
jgi:cytidylate kinase